jgi:hypothetical protein
MTKYKYVVENEITKIYFKDKTEVEREVLIDTLNLDKFLKFKYKWSLKYYRNIDGFYVAATEYLGVNCKPMYRTVLLHKYLTGLNGNEQVDHINNNTLDTRLINLRKTDNIKNAMNRSGNNKNNTSGERNVSWSNSTNKWLVQLQVNGRNTCFGRFDYEDLDKAKELARLKRKELYNIS